MFYFKSLYSQPVQPKTLDHSSKFAHCCEHSLFNNPTAVLGFSMFIYNFLLDNLNLAGFLSD